MADRLYDVIHADIEAGALPAGAILPAPERVAQELTIKPAAVEAAYARLQSEGHLESRDGGALAIAAVVDLHLVRGGTRDLPAFVIVPTLLMVVAAAASRIPARRAVAIDPASVLRSQ